jgi:hypothetical protein
LFDLEPLAVEQGDAGSDGGPVDSCDAGPPTPFGVSACVISAQQSPLDFTVQVSWRAATAGIRGFYLQRRDTCGGAEFADFLYVDGGDATSATDTVQCPGWDYSYRVVSLNDCGRSAPGDPLDPHHDPFEPFCGTNESPDGGDVAVAFTLHFCDQSPTPNPARPACCFTDSGC